MNFLINIYHIIYHYFDKLEDRIRGRLSRYPILYSLIAGSAIVLFWRGIWKIGDDAALFIPKQYAWIDGPLSVLISVVVLLATGLFMSFFVNDQIILSGLRQEKKTIDKTESEIEDENKSIIEVEEKIDIIEKEVEEIRDTLKK
jgi:hypothetical protein